MTSNIKFFIRKYLPEGGGKRNFLFTSSSRAVIIFLSFIFTPIFSRIYSPEAYGYFSILNILTIHYGIISTLGYADAILVARSRGEVYRLSILSFFFIILTSLAYFILFPFIVQLLDVTIKNEIKFLFVIIPVLMAILSVLSKWPQYYNQFKFSTSYNVIANIIIRVIGLLWGLFASIKSYGLIVAEGIGRLFSLVVYLKKYPIRLDLKSLYRSLPYFVDTLKTHRDNPMYLVPTKYINVLTSQIPLLYIAGYFDVALLGQLSMAMSLLTYPLALVGNAMSPVLLRRITSSPIIEQNNLINRLNSLVTLICIGPVLLAMIYAEEIFTLFLGDKWQISGHMASILILTLIHELVFLIFSGVFLLKKLQQSLFLIDVISVIFFGAIYYLLSVHTPNVFIVIQTFAIVRLIALVVKSSFLFYKLSLKKAAALNFATALILLWIIQFVPK